MTICSLTAEAATEGLATVTSVAGRAESASSARFTEYQEATR